MARTKVQDPPTPQPVDKPISDIAPEDPGMTPRGTPGSGTAPEQAPRQPEPANEEEIRARASHRDKERGRADG